MKLGRKLDKRGFLAVVNRSTGELLGYGRDELDALLAEHGTAGEVLAAVHRATGLPELDDCADVIKAARPGPDAGSQAVNDLALRVARNLLKSAPVHQPRHPRTGRWLSRTPVRAHQGTRSGSFWSHQGAVLPELLGD